MRSLALGLLLVSLASWPAAAQRLAHVDSEYLLSRLPEYQTAQQNVDRLAQQWQAELQEMEAEVEALRQDFAARELLYTEEERTAKQEEIQARAREVDAFRLRYFGPEGELFREQQAQMRPIQERVLAAIEQVAEDDNYDYIFDRSGDYVFLFVKPEFDVSDRVLEELGVDLSRIGQR